MSQIVPYLFEPKEVRVVLDENGEPWFVAADAPRQTRAQK